MCETMSGNGTTNSTIPLSDAEIALIGIGSGGFLLIAVILCVWWRVRLTHMKTETSPQSEKKSLLPTAPPNQTPQDQPPPPSNPNPEPVGKQYVTLKVDKFMRRDG